MSSLAPPLVADSNLVAGIPQQRAIGSLWRRIVAALLDGLIVGLAAMVVTLPFFDALSRLGAWGRLLGFFLALPYFAILNSKIGNGQTLGKRWMRIQVIDETGQTLTFSRSTVRYTVLAIPYFLDGLILPASTTPSAVTSLISLIVLTVGGATVYLVLFNRRTRQGVHDLVAGSYVADASNPGAIHVPSIWKPHWVILTASLIALFAGGTVLGNKLLTWGPFPGLLEEARLVENVDGVQSAAVQDWTSTTWGSPGSKKTLVVSVRCPGRTGSDAALADNIARVLMREDPKVRDHDALRIVVIHGYDIGIAHAQSAHSFEHTPAAWNTRLFGPPAGRPQPANALQPTT